MPQYFRLRFPFFQLSSFFLFTYGYSFFSSFSASYSFFIHLVSSLHPPSQRCRLHLWRRSNEEEFFVLLSVRFFFHFLMMMNSPYGENTYGFYNLYVFVLSSFRWCEGDYLTLKNVWTWLPSLIRRQQHKKRIKSNRKLRFAFVIFLSLKEFSFLFFRVYWYGYVCGVWVWVLVRQFRNYVEWQITVVR